MHRLWNQYRNAISRNFFTTDVEKNLAYWRNRLFAESMIYLLPFCLIALIPGVYWSVKTGLFVLAFFDVVVVSAVAYISLAPGIAVRTRKFVFILCTYLLAVVILYYVGLQGPGLIYLYASCLFGIFFLNSVTLIGLHCLIHWFV